MPTPPARHPELLAYRSEFPLLERSTYLNTCSLGARSERSRRRLETFLADWDELGARAWYRRWLGELDGLRDDFGAIVGVAGSEISLAPNVSSALAVVASAIDPIHRGDRATLDRLRRRRRGGRQPAAYPGRDHRARLSDDRASVAGARPARR